jgi:hypothetical protein
MSELLFTVEDTGRDQDGATVKIDAGDINAEQSRCKPGRMVHGCRETWIVTRHPPTSLAKTLNLVLFCTLGTNYRVRVARVNCCIFGGIKGPIKGARLDYPKNLS